jgi:site-specific DNA-methyltransferase (adenine-specific)
MLPQDFYYPKMLTKDICALPVRDIAEEDSVLFLWGTVPLIQDAFLVLESWGYRYKTMLFWRKIMSLGMGFWFRGQVEILLLGIRGKVSPFRIQKKNIIEARVRAHSQKPDEFYTLLETIPLEPRIELFARQRRPGGDCWGNEVDSDIDLTAPYCIH